MEDNHLPLLRIFPLDSLLEIIQKDGIPIALDWYERRILNQAQESTGLAIEHDVLCG